MGLMVIRQDGRMVPCKEGPYDEAKLISAKLHTGRAKEDTKDNNNNSGGGGGGSGNDFDPSDPVNGPMQVSFHDLDNANEDQMKADERKINAGGPATAKKSDTPLPLLRSKAASIPPLLESPRMLEP